MTRRRWPAVAATAVVVGALTTGAFTVLRPADHPGGSDATGAVMASSVLLPLEVPKPVAKPAAKRVSRSAGPRLPADSGTGRRIVFDQSQQHVWIADGAGKVVRSYPVSGSRFDNLSPGTYSVSRKLRHATSFDYTGTMQYFVEFARGRNAPIGFHDIPVYNDGTPEQTVEQLGTALSAGCIRQKPADAKFLWDFADLGTTVVVVA